MSDCDWDPAVKKSFDQMIEKIPVFLRGTALERVSRKAQELAGQRNSARIEMKDMVDAFFAATPFGFHGPMKNDMKDLGIDYAQYGYDH